MNGVTQMLSIPALEAHFSCTYPNTVSADTLLKRQKDVDELQTLVARSKAEHSLRYGEKEERVVLFTTRIGEKIAIQFPGKESAIANSEKQRPFDFRPKIITANGTVIKDMAFVDLWGVVEGLAHNHYAIIKVLSALFFHMGRMLLHDAVEESYDYYVLDANGTVTASGARRLSWYKLVLSNEICDSFNLHIPEIILDDGSAISFEAFIYFFEMLLQNEDSKYYYIKGNLSSGRIQTSDSMLQLSSYFNNTTSLSILLQRYISGFGVAKCPLNEIYSATGGLVTIVNRREQIMNTLTEESIGYRLNSSIRIQGESISAAITIPSKHIVILRHPDEHSEELLTHAGWTVFDLDTLVKQTTFDALVQMLAV